MNRIRTIVVQPYLKKIRVKKESFLNEALRLVRAIDLKCTLEVSVGLYKINPRTYLNSGYVSYLKNKKEEMEIDLI